MDISAQVTLPQLYLEPLKNKTIQTILAAIREVLIDHFRYLNAEENYPRRTRYQHYGDKSFANVKTDYYQDAGDSVSIRQEGDSVIASIVKEGIALHYYGGTVRPTRGRALAIPMKGYAVGRWPSEMTAWKMFCVWPKGRSFGSLFRPVGKRRIEWVYLLTGATHHDPDPGVLPTADAIFDEIADTFPERMEI